MNQPTTDPVISSGKLELCLNRQQLREPLSRSEVLGDIERMLMIASASNSTKPVVLTVDIR